MHKLRTKMNLTVVIALVVAFSGCSHIMNSGKATTNLASRPVADHKYSREIIELEQVVRQNSKSTEAKNAHLKLAQLYSDHNNRRRNYHLALENLEAYIILEESPVDGETLNWLASLKEINRLSKEISQVQKQLEKSNKTKLAFKRTNRKLTREEIKLRNKNRKLEETNQKLEKTIEMLKRLDRRLEEKRRTFNN